MICVVEIDGSQKTWRFHDIEPCREILSTWKPGEAADFSAFAALRIEKSYLYPCRRIEDWTECQVSAAASPGGYGRRAGGAGAAGTRSGGQGCGQGVSAPPGAEQDR